MSDVLEFPTVKLNETGNIIERLTGKATVYREDLGDGIALTMLWVPQGTFMMGSPANEEGGGIDEKPQHLVTVPGFWMGQFEVTQAQWRRVAVMQKVNQDLTANPSHFKGNQRPVEQVSWYDAVEFCARLSSTTGRTYRLPSEAEWEYACRAETTSPFAFGPTLNPEIANYNGRYPYSKGPEGVYREKTTEVGSFPANEFGLYDMHGNVWEWCEDWWYNSYDGAPNNGTARTIKGTEPGRLLRGGSWRSHPWGCRSAFRLGDLPVHRRNDVGFRLVCSLSAPRA